jgi:D-alanyl-D-alanine carboxypeptidase/D-alanyl-D-alanine-endopeptidase (penicillin-binding protein 4)
VGRGTYGHARHRALGIAETLRYRLEGVVGRVGDRRMLTLAIRDPRRAYGDAFAQALAERGIAVQAATRAGAGAGARASAPGCDLPRPLDTGGGDLVAHDARGAPGAREASQNQIAEAVFRSLGLARARSDARQRAAGRLRAARSGSSARARQSRCADGSGLSRHDYVTPRTLVRILDAMRQRPDSLVFMDALPVAGVDGTLANRMRGTPAERNVRAKTGTVDKARALSGYVTSADGELLLFSFLCNNHTVPTREVDAVQDAIAARLAAMRVRALGPAPTPRTAAAR